MEERLSPEFLVAAAILKSQEEGKNPTLSEIVGEYGIPDNIVRKAIRQLSDWGIITGSYGVTVRDEDGKISIGRIYKIKDPHKDEIKKILIKIGDVREYVREYFGRKQKFL